VAKHTIRTAHNRMTDEPVGALIGLLERIR